MFLLSVTSLGFLLLMSQRTNVCLGQVSLNQLGQKVRRTVWVLFENDVDHYAGEMCVSQMIDDIKYRQNSRPAKKLSRDLDITRL